MPKITLAGFLQISALSLRSFFGHVNIRTRHNFSEMVSLMLFTEIISLQHSHFIFAGCAAKDYSNLLGWGIAGSSYRSNCLPGLFNSVLSHCFPGCIPPSPRCDPHPLLQNSWLFLWPHWNKLFTGLLFSHQHLPEQPACTHCYLAPIPFSYRLQIWPALWDSFCHSQIRGCCFVVIGSFSSYLLFAFFFLPLSLSLHFTACAFTPFC